MSYYMRFLQMILNGVELEGVRLLSPKTVELMLSDNLPVGVEMYFNYGYGLGFSVLKIVSEVVDWHRPEPLVGVV